MTKLNKHREIPPTTPKDVNKHKVQKIKKYLANIPKDGEGNTYSTGWNACADKIKKDIEEILK